MRAYNIQWDIDIDEVLEIVEEMDKIEVAKLIGLTNYPTLTEKEREECIRDRVHHCPALADELVGLPDEIEVPESITDEEDISDWLSDKYGFCHSGFDLK